MLAGRLSDSGNGISSGLILVNGQKRNYDTFRHLSAYVLQGDRLALAAWAPCTEPLAPL